MTSTAGSEPDGLRLTTPARALAAGFDGGGARSGDGGAERALKRAQVPLVGGFALLVLVALVSVWFALAGHRYNASVTRTLQVRRIAYQLLSLVQDAETGERGYLLTGNALYLAPYTRAAAEVPAALQTLDGMLGGDGARNAALQPLHDAVDAKMRDLDLTTALKRDGKGDVALAHVNTNVGNAMMQRVRDVIGRVEEEESRAQEGLAAAAETNAALLAAATLCGIALVIALAAYAVVLSRRALRALVAAQRRLADANENLEALVAERVSELQLANDEIQRFAYIVSHDLRAPLVNVMGFTSELDATRAEIAGLLAAAEAEAPGIVTPERRLAVEADLPEALGFIRASTQKMDRLINAILKLSREGRRVLTPQPVDLRELVSAQGASLSQQLAAGQATLEVQPDLPGLTSDRLALEQIFGNLIENAIKYLAPNRPGRIAVTGEREGDHLRYLVSDNGRGIEAKDFERIFELFRRSGEQDRPGEGIGLATVRNLARRLGGNVTVQSDFGAGSIFAVTLPAILPTGHSRSKGNPAR